MSGALVALILTFFSMFVLGGTILIIIFIKAFTRDRKIRRANEKIMDKAHRDAKRKGKW